MYTEEQIRKAMRNAKANVEIEGVKVSKATEELVYLSLTGEITDEEFLERTLELVKKS